jgi:hypothetical protein
MHSPFFYFLLVYRKGVYTILNKSKDVSAGSHAAAKHLFLTEGISKTAAIMS